MDILTKIFKAVANERRGKIIFLLLKEDELPVSQIAEELNMSFKTVSSHLLKLENVGLLKRRQKKAWVYYSINRDSQKLFNQMVLKTFELFKNKTSIL